MESVNDKFTSKLLEIINNFDIAKCYSEIEEKGYYNKISLTLFVEALLYYNVIDKKEQDCNILAKHLCDLKQIEDPLSSLGLLYILSSLEKIRGKTENNHGMYI